MPTLRLGPLQWAIGGFCVSIGTLMLITPHQFASRTFLPLQPTLPWWGAWFLLAGGLLLAVAVLLPRRGLTVAAHLAAGSALLALAYAFTVNGAWTGTTNYLVLGLGTLLAPLLRQRQAAEQADSRDLYTLLMGLAGALTGAVMLLLPAQFRSPTYDLVRPWLPAHGLAFLLGGLALLATVIRRPDDRLALRRAHLLAGGAYLAFCLTFAIPNRGLPAITLYGVLGGILASLPWLAPRLQRIDPARLQTRLALSLAALAAVPLVLGVALATAQEERSATNLALSRQQTLATALAESVQTYVEQQRDAAEALAGELALAEPSPDAQRPVLERFQRAYAEVNTFNTYDAAGNPIARGDGRPLGPPIRDFPLFTTAQETLRPTLEVRTGRVLQLPVVALGAPILDAQGRFAGLVVGAFDTARLTEKAEQAATLQVGEIYVVDDRGRVIAHPDRALAASFTDRSAATPVVSLRERARPGSVTYVAPDGQRLVGYAPVADLGWGVIVDRPAAAVLAGVRAGRELTLTLLLLALGLAMGLSVVLARALAVPLGLLVDATRQLAQGEGRVPLPRSSIREVATLADTVGELRDSLAARTAERDRAELRLRLLADAGSTLTTSLDPDTTLNRVTALVIPALGDWCSIYLRGGEAQAVLAAVAHADPAKITLAHELHARYPADPDAPRGVAQVLRTGQPELMTGITDATLAAVAHDPEHLRLLRAIGFRTVMIVPLHARGSTLGALVLGSSDAARQYSADDLALAEELARRAALALDNARLYWEAQAERERFAVTLHSIGDAVIATDNHGLVTFLNPLAEALTGWPAAEAAGQSIHTIFEITNDGTGEPVENPVDRVLREGVVVGLANHTVLRARDGVVRPIDDSGAPIRDGAGQVIGAVLVFRDVSERRREEERQAFLADASALLAGSLDEAAVLQQLARLAVPRLADWCTVEVAGAGRALRLLALTHVDPAREAAAYDLRRRYPTDPTAPFGPPSVIRTGQSELYPTISDELLAASTRGEEELQLLRQAGFRSAMVVPIVARGRVLGALSLIAAESGRTYTEADLRLAEDLAGRAGLAVENARLYAAEYQAREAAERTTARIARLQNVTEALSGALTPEAVAEVVVAQGAEALGAQAGMAALLAPDGGSLAILRTLGYPLELTAQYPQFPLHAPFPLAETVRTGALVLISSAEEGRTRFPALASAQAQSGLQAWANVPLMLDRRCIGALEFSFARPRPFSLEDQAFLQTLGEQCAQALERARLYATEQRARAEAEAAVRVREQFLSIAAHELKTPLTPLLGQAQLMERRARREGHLGERDLRSLGVMASQAQRLDQLVTSMLDLNRLQTGRLSLDCTSLDLRGLVRRLAEELQPTLERHHFALDLPEEPVLVDGDALRLEQVLQNLVQNAVKYSPAGGPVAVRVSEQGDHATLQVRDWGIGIPAEALPRLFEPFFRAENAAQSVMPGMGVGLAVVKEIVTLHGGMVTATSVEGEGSIFTISLPRMVNQDRAAAPEQLLDTAGPEPGLTT